MPTLGPVLWHFESDAYPGARIHVASARWREALDAPFRAELELVIDAPDEDHLVLLGQDGVLVLERRAGGLERRLAGIVTEVELAQSTLPSRYTHVRAVLEPAFALLDLGQRSRVFQASSVPAILEAVLGEALGAYGREVEVAVEGTYPTREHCVQYRESDRAFAERLMQEEGIAYAFTHEGPVERMVLRDRNAQHPLAPVASDAVPFDPRHGMDLADDEIVHHARRVSRPRTTKVSIRDHDWTSPAEPIAGASGDGGRESYEFGASRHLTISDYAGSRYAAHDGARQSELRLEALARDGLVLEGRGRVIGFGAGSRFTLSGHGSELDGEWLIVEVEHVDAPFDPAAGTDPYSNRFVCIPAATAYRPSRTREKPRAASVQTAIVTGPAGEEIHTDSHGRVKVRFHWDREGASDGTSSCWLRVEQAWAGNGWGFSFLPRVGMEVVVHFVHGDPDRPVVHGCVYNSDNRPPYALDADKTKSTIKSNSSPGGGGFNELRFEDLAGSEQVYLHAQKDLDEVVLANHTTSVGGDQTNTVGHDQTQTVEGTQTETVDVDQTMTVDGNRNVKVTGAFTEVVLSGERRGIGQAESETVTSGGETRVVLGTLDEGYRATEKHFVFGGQTEVIVGGHTLTVGTTHDEGILGALSQIAVGGYTWSSTGGTFLADAGSEITLVGAAGATVSGTAMTINCTERIEVDPHRFKAKWTDFSSIGTKISDVYGVTIDVAGLVLDSGGVKVEGWAIGLEKFDRKLSILGLKADLTVIKKKTKGSSFSAASKIYL